MAKHCKGEVVSTDGKVTVGKCWTNNAEAQELIAGACGEGDKCEVHGEFTRAGEIKRFGFARTEIGNNATDPAQEAWDCMLGGLAQMRLEFAEGELDRVEVRRTGFAATLPVSSNRRTQITTTLGLSP